MGRLLPKEQLHIFQNHPFGLGHKQEGKDKGENRACAEEEEHAALNPRHHIRQGIHDDKLGEPLHAPRAHHAEAAHVGGKNLGAEDPRDAGPRKGVADSVEIEGGDGGIGAPNAPNQEWDATAEAVDDENHEDESDDKLDDAIEARGEELEGIYAREVLEHHQRHADEDSTPDAAVFEMRQAMKDGLLAAGHFGFVGDLALDLIDLLLHPGMIRRKIAHPGQVFERSLVPALRDQPTGRLDDERHGEDEEAGGNELDRHRNVPLSVGGVRNAEFHPVVDPEAAERRTGQHDLEDADQATADRRGRAFRDINGNDHGGGAHTEPGDEAPNVEDLDVGEEVQHHAHDKEDAASGHRPFPPVSLRQEGADDDAEERAALEDTHDVGGLGSRHGAREPERSLKGGQGDGPADEGGAIAIHGTGLASG
ncbi:hypothetical protein BP5796_07681 [Coleophoma crateriformis]|uniref:Uncharacterized protein n=1 Tax=Coleophoma crateriformis TaxID=565419 RepID=A0A3D8RC64_9HELO|nr:hypothetical protein BP5796_07681 [Coleophoma crateriformis]